MNSEPQLTRKPGPRAGQLKITEIFYSVQGEADTMGWPTVFIRLTGCPLRCRYCDTEYAFHGGRWMTFEEILGAVSAYAPRYVTVTGGEPLAQKRCPQLLQELCDGGYRVSLETSGAMDISVVDKRVVTVLDVKTPASGEAGRNRWENLAHLRADDQVKFVICDRADYEWARDCVSGRKLAESRQVLFSPSHDQLGARELADWILEDRLPVRFQLQMHKYIWGDVPGK